MGCRLLKGLKMSDIFIEYDVPDEDEWDNSKYEKMMKEVNSYLYEARLKSFNVEFSEYTPITEPNIKIQIQDSFVDLPKLRKDIRKILFRNGYGVYLS